MLLYYIPYSRLQGLLQGGEPEFKHCLRELVEGEKMVELKCSHCGGFFITHYRPGSLGKPTPGLRLALLDEHYREVPPGAEGEIALQVRPERPVGLFEEYWRNPEETARKFQGDWYLTGDRAVGDADGYLWFVGRKDDVIKSSGYRIGPFEVESALMEHPAVLDVAVIGKPDPLRGQIVKACVVLRVGFDPTDDLKVELQTHCKSLIAAYKYPREIEFVTELPKTTSGKTRHVVLRTAASASRA